MDLLFKRYANPFPFMDGMIQTGRFSEFVQQILEKTNSEREEQTAWEFFLHKVWEGSFADFKGGIGLLIPGIQPQAGLAVAPLGDEVGLVDGEALVHAVVHDMLELISAITAGIVANRGGDVGKGLPVRVAQPEEGGSVCVLIVALILHRGNEAMLSKGGIPRSLGGDDLARLKKSPIGGVRTGNRVGPLPDLGGGEAHRPGIALHPEAGEGDHRTVGMGEGRVDLGGYVGVFVIHLTVENDLGGRPDLGGVGLLGLRKAAVVGKLLRDFDGHDRQARKLHRLQGGQGRHAVHAEDPFGDHVAHELVGVMADNKVSASDNEKVWAKHTKNNI